MARYRSDLPPLPRHMQHLPIDERGFPVPWFVGNVDGKPDFRVINSGAIDKAVRSGLCWLCGKGLGKWKAYVVGPMCGINRTTSEPPCHQVCADYAVKACPFLTRPQATRSARPMPAEAKAAVGLPIDRNPGVTLVWTVTGVPHLLFVDGGYLFRLPEPAMLAAYAKGRTATAAELNASIDSGLPIFLAAAAKDGPDAIAELGALRMAFADLCSRLIKESDHAQGHQSAPRI